jgi:hypothetical protein
MAFLIPLRLDYCCRSHTNSHPDYLLQARYRLRK